MVAECQNRLNPPYVPAGPAYLQAMPSDQIILQAVC